MYASTPVGILPLGASEQAVLDLAGNVWQWCLNKYEDTSALQADTSDAVRVLRGGSWGNYQVSARCTGCFRFSPVERYHFVGFRVLRLSPSSIPDH